MAAKLSVLGYISVTVKTVSSQDLDFLMLISFYSNIFSVRPMVWLQSAEP